MHWRKIGVTFLTVLLVANAVFADVIPLERPWHPKRGLIRLTVTDLPAGMVVLAVAGGPRQKLLGMAQMNEALVVSYGCEIFAAWQKQLSVPFSYNRDKGKLLPLRTIDDYEIPQSFGSVESRFESCSVQEGKAGTYFMQCRRETAAPVPPIFKKPWLLIRK